MEDFSVICPVCKNKDIHYESVDLDIPYFGKVTETVLYCDKCGYRHIDEFLPGVKEPVEYRYVIQNEDDMSVRVIRSSTGKIEIPELGVTVEPGITAEGFVSNIEGILNRVKNIVEQLTPNNPKKCTELLDKIDKIKKGKEKVTLIITDPEGNSAIIHKNAQKIVGMKQST